MSLDAARGATLESKIDRLLLEAIDEALSSLGQSPKRAIYHHLEEDFHIAKSEIPQKIRLFNWAMEDIFQDGASPLKTLMMRKIHHKVGGELAWTGDTPLTFPKYVTAVKQNFLKEEINSTEGK
ncbi:MAG: hypothetical protein ACOC6G_00550 [Thermoproteota archaeon]